MVRAEELLKKLKEKEPDVMVKVFCGVREHCENRIVEEALKGRDYYTIYLKDCSAIYTEAYAKKVNEIMQYFSDLGYKVSAEIHDNEKYGVAKSFSMSITFSWNI